MMRTWSLGDVLDVLKHVERITRPPRRHDGAEQLAESEAEEECSEPSHPMLWCIEHNGLYGHCRYVHNGYSLATPGSSTRHRKVCNMCDTEITGTDYNYCEDHRGDDTPNPTEPSLSDDELVGVRELLERFGLTDVPAPSAVGTSPAGGVTHSPESSPAVVPLATWLEPAVQTMLGWHEYRFGHDTNCECGALGIFDWTDWQDHVAPLIAAHIAQALPDYPAASPRHSFVGGLQAAANIVGAEAQRVWRAVLDSPSANPVLDGMTVARRLDAITQQLRDHATEYSTTK